MKMADRGNETEEQKAQRLRFERLVGLNKISKGSGLKWRKYF